MSPLVRARSRLLIKPFDFLDASFFLRPGIPADLPGDRAASPTLRPAKIGVLKNVSNGTLISDVSSGTPQAQPVTALGSGAGVPAKEPLPTSLRRPDAVVARHLIERLAGGQTARRAARPGGSVRR